MSIQKLTLYLLLTITCQQGISQINLDHNNQTTLERIEKYTKLSTEREELMHKAIPAFDGIDILTGAIITDEDIQGKITILNFNTSAEYCTPANSQHDELNYMYHNIDTSQVQIISIYSDEVEEIYKNRKVEEDGFPIIQLDKNEVEALFKIHTAPINLIIDENGIIRVMLKNSNSHTLEKELKKLQLVRA